MELIKKEHNPNTHIFGLDRESVNMEIAKGGMNHITYLLSNLYKNPIEATVRELMSNAIDSTRLMPEARREPIRVQLPNEFDGTFSVEDFGVGMSKEDLFSVYSQYGASTKGDDFSQVGAFGLGAKAPLSYTSKFTVTSTKDGITTEVFISSNESGNKCELISEKETGKPNGTLVSVPVKEKEFLLFAQAFEYYPRYIVDIKLIVDGKEANLYEHILLGTINPSEDNNPDFELPVYAIKEKGGSRTVDEIILNSMLGTNRAFGMFYCMVLSGWSYFTLGKWSLMNHCEVFVDLKPGVFTFNPSRDEIVETERNNLIEYNVSREIKSLIQRLSDNLIKENGNSLEDYIKFLIKNKISIREQSMLLSNIVKGNVDVEDKIKEINTVFRDVFDYNYESKLFGFNSIGVKEYSKAFLLPDRQNTPMVDLEKLISNYYYDSVLSCVLIKTDKNANQLNKEIKLLAKDLGKGKNLLFLLSSEENAEEELMKYVDNEIFVFQESELRKHEDINDLRLFNLGNSPTFHNDEDEWQKYVSQVYSTEELESLNEDTCPILVFFDKTTPRDNLWKKSLKNKEIQVMNYLNEVHCYPFSKLNLYAMDINDLDDEKVEIIKDSFQFCFGLDEIKRNNEHKELSEIFGEEFAPRFLLEIDNHSIEGLAYLIRKNDIQKFTQVEFYLDYNLNRSDYELTSELFAHLLYSTNEQDSITDCVEDVRTKNVIKRIYDNLNQFFDIKGNRNLENVFISAMSKPLFNRFEQILKDYIEE